MKRWLWKAVARYLIRMDDENYHNLIAKVMFERTKEKAWHQR